MTRTILAAFALLALASCGQPASDSGAKSAAPAPAAEDHAAEIAALPAPLNEANYENGRRVFAQCRSCHLITDTQANGVGPNLHGLMGAQAGGHRAGYRYSAAMQASSLTWDAATLDRYLADPRGVVPGTIMAFAGVRDPEDRRDLIAYLSIESAR